VVNFTNQCLSQGLNDSEAPYLQSYTRECGSDSDLCGGTCGPLNGGCPLGKTCQLEAGICVSTPNCDLFVPVCNISTIPSGGQFYCNNNCEWSEINDQLPDIIPDTEESILASLVYHWRNFDNVSCAFHEQCVPYLGWNLLLRFDTNIHNQGTVSYFAPSPFARPDLLTYATCHQHYHENGFAFYYLSFQNFTIGINSLKRSYCVETSGSSQTGPKVPCVSLTTCCQQGLEPGNFDSYNSDLDCQWMSVNDLYNANALGSWLLYAVTVNQHRSIIEYSFLNNVNQFQMFVPCAPAQTKIILYPEYVSANPYICCHRPGGPSANCPAPAGGCLNAPVLPTCLGSTSRLSIVMCAVIAMFLISFRQ